MRAMRSRTSCSVSQWTSSPRRSSWAASRRRRVISDSLRSATRFSSATAQGYRLPGLRGSWPSLRSASTKLGVRKLTDQGCTTDGNKRPCAPVTPFVPSHWPARRPPPRQTEGRLVAEGTVWSLGKAAVGDRADRQLRLVAAVLLGAIGEPVVEIDCPSRPARRTRRKRTTSTRRGPPARH